MTGIAIAARAGGGRLAVTVAPTSLSSTGTTASHTFGACVASVRSAAGAVTYAWTLVNTSGFTATFTGQGTASATITVSGLAHGDDATGTLTCAVTDAAGKHATSNAVAYDYARP